MYTVDGPLAVAFLGAVREEGEALGMLATGVGVLLWRGREFELWRRRWRSGATYGSGPGVFITPTPIESGVFIAPTAIEGLDRKSVV